MFWVFLFCFCFFFYLPFLILLDRTTANSYDLHDLLLSDYNCSYSGILK